MSTELHRADGEREKGRGREREIERERQKDTMPKERGSERVQVIMLKEKNKKGDGEMVGERKGRKRGKYLIVERGE